MNMFQRVPVPLLLLLFSVEVLLPSYAFEIFPPPQAIKIQSHFGIVYVLKPIAPLSNTTLNGFILGADPITKKLTQIGP